MKQLASIRRRGARVSFLAAASLVLFLAPAQAPAVSQEDQVFFEFLVKELGYLDTAERWVASLEAKARDRKDQCDLLFWRISIADRRQDEATASRLREELKKRCPDHQSVALGGLSAVIGPWTKVAELLDGASRMSDKTKAAAAVAEAVRKFTEEVEKPLDGLIASLNAQVEEAKKKEREARQKDKSQKAKPKSQSGSSTLAFARDTAEVARLKIYLLFARKLPGDHPARKTTLEKGLKLAEEFVDGRFDFFDLYEMGRHDAARDALGILFDAGPPGAPPFEPAMVSFFKNLRLQAILYGARSRNEARNFEEAVKELQKHLLKPTKDDFDLSQATQSTEGDLRQLAVLARLEYGIALTGSGKAREGLDLIQKVIKEERDEGLVTDARKALGRVAGLRRVELRARDYYEAAVGLKSAGKLEEAIETFKLALASLNPRNVKEVDEVAPLCLNEIGEVNYMIDRFYESLLAYQEFARLFKTKEIPVVTRKVAQNFLALARQVIDKIEGNATHSALAKIKGEAEAFSRKWSDDEDFAIYRSIMQDGQNLEGQGKFDAARKKYQEVPKQVKGKMVDFYWRAQALAHTCSYREWDRADEGGKKALEPALDKAMKALKTIVPAAIKDRDLPGAALAALIQGQVHYQKSQYREAVDALQPFRSELQNEPIYKGFGLGSLVLASAQLGDCAQAEKDFELLDKDAGAREESIFALAALELSDCFDAAGDAKKAGQYMLAYVKHPSSKADLMAVDPVVLAANRLVRGGYAKEGRALLGDFAKGVKSGAEEQGEISRQIALIDARTALAARKWDEAILKFDGYLKKYPAKGDHRDDPYVLRDFAEAYLGRHKAANGSKKKNGKTAPAQEDEKSDLERADELYGAACGLLDRVRQFDKAIEPVFWRWVYRYLEIKMLQADTPSYRAVVSFIDDHQASDMGGLKEKFLKLRDQAAAKLEGKAEAPPAKKTENRSPPAAKKPKAQGVQ
jgi:hypothetical protein